MKSKKRETLQLGPKPEPLEVRRHIGPLKGLSPRTEMKPRDKWVPCVTIAEAREYAASHGYSGITIKLV